MNGRISNRPPLKLNEFINQKLPEVEPCDLNEDPVEALARFFVLGNSTPTRPINGQPQNRKQFAFKGLNIIDIGRQFFGSIPKEKLFSRFLELYEHVPVYVANQQSNLLYRESLTHSQFFFKTFLLFCRSIAPQNAYKKGQSLGPFKPCIPISETEMDQFLILLARLEFPIRCKIWSLLAAAKIILVHGNKLLEEAILRAKDHKEVTFCALSFGFHRYGCAFNTEEDMQTLMLLGRTSGQFVEEFLGKRTEEAREYARRALTEVEAWSLDEELFNRARKRLCDEKKQKVLTFEEFSDNIGDMMCELRKEMPRCNKISKPWAYVAFSKALQKRYGTGEWGIEHLYDLAFCLIKQRPEMRSHIVKELRERCADPKAAMYWQKFDCTLDTERVKMQRLAYSLENRMKRQPPEGEYLKLPADVDIFFVDNAMKLACIEHNLRGIQRTGRYTAVVGLDAEWSAYVLTSRASIIQIAFEKMVCIIDLDQIDDHAALTEFMDRLFLDENILKIGFHFGEDLVQIRRRLPNCNSLYEPESLICISRVVEKLISITTARNLNPEKFINLEKAKERRMDDSIVAADTSVIEDEHDDTLPLTPVVKMAEKKEDSTVKTLGLSALCMALLGGEVNKIEQCSVWDRRPLRNSQLQYAALDAHAMLMLYDSCSRWAQQLGENIDTICAEQERYRIPLPLLFDKTKLESHKAIEVCKSPWDSD
ncbi:unnamed protein product [Bursaphelenchus okinawaensis]|uniref:3'-5' exonuclease domain-containing protein n=1 Tax=Bursaphelenchus okinawaensis TaxID=465554 RepID=A0A811K5X6_9BILA|nr:unnamed protein product [Bursaphelenchus okinawaensis]CAG9092134.1 unnamed protein product [Bursaphelenchus okinawaensis]